LLLGFAEGETIKKDNPLLLTWKKNYPGDWFAI